MDIKAILALAILVPASHATTINDNPFPLHKRDRIWWPTIYRWEELYAHCVLIPLRDEEGNDLGANTKACKAAAKLKKKLKANGYCTFGQGVVGRTGKYRHGRKPCYTIPLRDK